MHQACVLQDGLLWEWMACRNPIGKIQGLKSNAETALGLPDPEPEGKSHGVQRPGQQFYWQSLNVSLTHLRLTPVEPNMWTHSWGSRHLMSIRETVNIVSRVSFYTSARFISLTMPHFPGCQIYEYSNMLLCDISNIVCIFSACWPKESIQQRWTGINRSNGCLFDCFLATEWRFGQFSRFKNH